MDTPFFKDFNRNTPIDIQIENETVQLFPFTWKRGVGNKKWHLSIEGITRKQVSAMTQCVVQFRGSELGGHFAAVNEGKGVWQVTFETLIPEPAFWGETQ